MATSNFNPYPQIGTQLIKGMDNISGVLKPTSTVDDLVNAIYKFIQPIYYPSTDLVPVPNQIEQEIKSVAYNIINSYNSNGYYNDCNVEINSIPINSIDKWLSDIEDSIPTTRIEVEKQTPLLLALEVGKTIYPYWIDKVNTPGTWAPFFQKPDYINYSNIPFWVLASMQGAFIGATISKKGLISPTTDIVSVNIISSLIGALVLGAGKVIFKFTPRVQSEQVRQSAPLKALVSMGPISPSDPVNKQNSTFVSTTYSRSTLFGLDYDVYPDTVSDQGGPLTMHDPFTWG